MASCKPFALDLAGDQSGLPHYQPPPCQVACPIGTDVASYVGLIWSGDKEAALEAITATNPLFGDLRPGLRRAVRTGLPPHRLRRAGGDPRLEALGARCPRPRPSSCRRFR